jgi:pyruvate kinase
LLKEHCPKARTPPQLIAKIENGEGLKNLDEIIKASDGIMVARGDLGMEIPPERVFLAQKMAIAKCNMAGKVVITATQMLESMTSFPRPTRAEASDVANAVLDGTDCVMLSGETAAGNFPIESANMMVQICREAERSMDFVLTYERMAEAWRDMNVNADEAICNAAVRLAIDSRAKMILSLTVTGFTPRQIAKYKPPVPICVVAPTHDVCKSLALVRGVVSLPTPVEFDEEVGTAPVVKAALEEAKGFGIVSPGDTIVVVHRALDQHGPGFTNLVKAMPVT